MTITTGTAPELLWPGLLQLFGDTYAQWPEIYSKISEKRDTDKYFDKIQGLTGFGAAAVKNEGQSVVYDDLYQGFQKEAVQVMYALGAKITMEMMRFDQYDKMNKIPAGLARSFRHTQEIIVADQYNRAFTTATTGDGLSICNTAHKLVAGGTFRNRPTVATDITMTALEAAYTDISNFNDDRGLPMMAKPKKIVVSTSDALVTRKILGTAYAVGSNNNDVNVVSTDYQNVELVVNPYLTDTDAWFVLTDVENGVLYIESIKPEPDKDMVFDSKDLKFTVHGGFSVVTADPRAVWGSPGA